MYFLIYQKTFCLERRPDDTEVKDPKCLSLCEAVIAQLAAAGPPTCSWYWVSKVSHGPTRWFADADRRCPAHTARFHVPEVE